MCDWNLIESGLKVRIYSCSSTAHVLCAGWWQADLRHGTGEMRYAGGEVYRGEWFAGERQDPRGLYLFPGGRFVGSWWAGRRSGPGVSQWTGGSTFLGLWRDDKVLYQRGRGETRANLSRHNHQRPGDKVN